MKTQMTIGRKFALTSGMLILLTIVLGVASLVGLNSIGKRAKSLSEDALEGVSACSKVESALLELRGDISKQIGASSSSQMAPIESHINTLKQEIAAGLADVGKAINSDEERELN